MYCIEGVLRESAARCTCPYDMLRRAMREMYYRLIEHDRRPTRMIAGYDALCGYEMLSEQNDPPVTTFKDLVVAFDPTLAADVMRFLVGNDVVGELWNIS